MGTQNPKHDSNCQAELEPDIAVKVEDRGVDNASRAGK